MLLFLLTAGPITAQDATKPEDPSRFSLTIYSTADAAAFDPQAVAQLRRLDPHYKIPGYAVVRETRKVTLDKGRSTVKFPDVAAGIDPTTVSFKSLTTPDSTSVLEQSFAYDLASPERLLEKYVGKNIIINRRQTPLATDRTRMPDTIEARLLAVTNDQLVLQTSNRQLPIQIVPRSSDIWEIKLFDLQGGLTTTPTLVWTVTTDKPGDHDVAVSYQTDHITWRADYRLVVNPEQTNADLSAWVSIVNESGASYPNAKLKLIAGEVNRPRQDQPPIPLARAEAAAAPDGFTQKPFADYHLYTLSRTTSIPDGSTKQIQLLATRPNLPVAKSYVYEPLSHTFHIMAQGPFLHRDPGLPVNKNVDVHLKFANNEKTGLGLPLPAGRIRVYKHDGDGGGAPEFIGEDKIDHTAKNQEIALRLGQAFDITADRKQIDFTYDEAASTLTETIEIKLTNQKNQPVQVLIKEHPFRAARWEITKSSEKWQKNDARTVHIPVEIPAGGEKVVTFSLKYAW